VAIELLSNTVAHQIAVQIGGWTNTSHQSPPQTTQTCISTARVELEEQATNRRTEVKRKRLLSCWFGALGAMEGRNDVMPRECHPLTLPAAHPCPSNAFNTSIGSWCGNEEVAQARMKQHHPEERGGDWPMRHELLYYLFIYS
jgi:hypothetical protein